MLETWFNILGWPSNVRSDRGPQFLGPFRKWCQENNITHELSSPYNPKSNGLAEAGVKNVKLLLSKCSITKEDPQRALYSWRNIPRKDGYSPAQLLTQSQGRKSHFQIGKSCNLTQLGHLQHRNFVPGHHPCAPHFTCHLLQKK